MSTLKKIAIAAGVIVGIRAIILIASANKQGNIAAAEAAAALKKKGIQVGPKFASNYKSKMTPAEHELFMKSFYQSEDPTPEQQRIMAKVLTF